MTFAFSLAFAGPAAAQLGGMNAEFAGAGARALAMGGAFIALADDATAAESNPAGLWKLRRPELAMQMVYSWDDRYVGQFMSQKFDPSLFKNKHYNFHEICRVLGKVDFVIIKSTKSLATHGKSNEKNRELYAQQMIPKLKDVATQLNELKITYQAIDGTNQNFTCVDVEMALFAFASQNKFSFM